MSAVRAPSLLRAVILAPQVTSQLRRCRTPLCPEALPLVTAAEVRVLSLQFLVPVQTAVTSALALEAQDRLRPPTAATQALVLAIAPAAPVLATVVRPRLVPQVPIVVRVQRLRSARKVALSLLVLRTRLLVA